jgi:hypothetical protein
MERYIYELENCLPFLNEDRIKFLCDKLCKKDYTLDISKFNLAVDNNLINNLLFVSENTGSLIELSLSFYLPDYNMLKDNSNSVVEVRKLTFLTNFNLV